MQAFVLTTRELAERLGMSVQQLSRGYMIDPRHPPKERRGWPLQKWQAFVALKKEEGKARLRGANVDIRRQKIELECERLRLDLRKASGELADVSEIVDRMTSLHAAMVTRLGTWRESSIAKRPELRREIEEIARQLQEAMATVEG